MTVLFNTSSSVGREARQYSRSGKTVECSRGGGPRVCLAPKSAAGRTSGRPSMRPARRRSPSLARQTVGSRRSIERSSRAHWHRARADVSGDSFGPQRSQTAFELLANQLDDSFGDLRRPFRVTGSRRIRSPRSAERPVSRPCSGGRPQQRCERGAAGGPANYGATPPGDLTDTLVVARPARLRTWPSASPRSGLRPSRRRAQAAPIAISTWLAPCS